jgi:hypothetical protein
MDCSHTKKRRWLKYQRSPREAGREEYGRISGEEQLSEKWVGAGIN